MLGSYFQFSFAGFPFNTNDPIKVHAFGFEPCFKGFAGVRTELDEHLSFGHVDQNALGARRAAALHALRERLRTLAREASECVLREITWHWNSQVELKSKYSIEGYFNRRRACTPRQKTNKFSSRIHSSPP